MAEIEKFFSERAQANEEYYHKVIEPTAWEFEQTKRLIDVFPDLMSLDYVPKKFLAILGDTFGYPYLETEEEEVQREIFKHLVEVYKRKGSRGLFEEALRYSYNSNYAIGTLTYYRGKIEPNDFSISYPRDKMFQYDVSKWNEKKWPNRESVALGIIDIEVNISSDRMERYLDELIPAGIKYAITITKSIHGDDGPIVFPWTAIIEVETDIDLIIDHIYIREGDILLFDRRKYDYSIWNGRSVVDINTWVGTRESKGYYLFIRPSDRFYKASQVPEDWTPKVSDEMRRGKEF